MMLSLSPHPRCTGHAVATAVTVTVDAGGVGGDGMDGGLELVYAVSAPPGHLFVPATAPAARRDNLWRTTCAECFVATQGALAYREFNFSPSGAWAVYDFAAPRQRLADPPVATPPRIGVTLAGGTLTVRVMLVPDLLPAAPWQAGVSVVCAGGDGTLAYWALAHPAPQPDFHHRDGFRLSGPSPLTLELR